MSIDIDVIKSITLFIVTAQILWVWCSLHYGEDVVSIRANSEEQEIPRKYRAQILNDLKRPGAAVFVM